MKAAQIKEYGGIDKVENVDIDKPVAGEGQVLVEVYASSLNPVDTYIREGHARQMADIPLPATLGGDIAGVVAEVGEGIGTVAVGDKVYGQSLALMGNSGAFAEFAVTSSGQIAHIPTNVDFQQAAALPLAGVSALQALTKHLNLQSAQRIFIHGGAGGIGTIAIQIAKHIGAYVATTASGENIDLVKQLGADEVIDYKTQDFSSMLKDFDAVLDNVGGEEFNKSLKILKRGGIAVSLAGKADESLAAELGVTTMMQMTQVTTEMLDSLRALVESGAVKPMVDKVYTLGQIKEAFEAREKQSVKGKVVIAVR